MWTFTEDFEAYAEAAESFLLDDPVSNTVPLTVLSGLRAGMPADGAYFGWWTVDGKVRGAAFRTPPAPLGLARMPAEAVTQLAEALRDRRIPEVMGPTELADTFVAAYGTPVAKVVAERLYRLGTLNAPGTPGHGRRATQADLPLLVSWYHAFNEEVRIGNRGDIVERVARRLAGGDLFIWESGGAPVSFAALSAEAGGVRRIGPVYTPPSSRRHGYGAAITAHASQIGLAERAAEIVLFTDLDNPTSNAIYQSIGYEPLSDYAHITFAP